MSAPRSFRHEVGVAYSPVQIIYADEQLVVVNKPASVPVSERQKSLPPTLADPRPLYRLTHPYLFFNKSSFINFSFFVLPKLMFT